MAKKETGITRVQPDLSLPAHLQQQEVVGLDELKDIIVPPRLKIVQKQARDELLEKFDKGSTIIMPQEALVAGVDEPFLFVPLFFYREFCTWTPLSERGKMPAVIERTLDKSSDLAAKCANPKLRVEDTTYEGQKVKVRHIEHLNYIVMLYGHDFSGEPMVMGFSKAEYRSGSSFAALLKMRKASLFNCVFQARVSSTPRENSEGSWHGWDVTNPMAAEDEDPISPWVTAEESEVFAGLHEGFKKKHSDGLIQANYEDDASEEEEGTAEAAEY